MPPKKVVSLKARKHVYVNKLCDNKEKVTVVLACNQAGDKLPPCIVVKSNSQKPVRPKLINGILVFFNPKTSMMNSDLMTKWLKVYFDK